MMSLTLGLFTQVSGSGPLGPLVLFTACICITYVNKIKIFTISYLFGYETMIFCDQNDPKHLNQSKTIKNLCSSYKRHLNVLEKKYIL